MATPSQGDAAKLYQDKEDEAGKLLHGSWRMDRAESRLGDESAADTYAALSRRLLPDGLQIYANRRKNRNVQNGQEISRQFLSRIQFDRDTTETEIQDAG